MSPCRVDRRHRPSPGAGVPRPARSSANELAPAMNGLGPDDGFAVEVDMGSATCWGRLPTGPGSSVSAAATGR
jgi:hypothetical protein